MNPIDYNTHRMYYIYMKKTKAFSIRVDEDLYNIVAEIAEKEERTINSQIIYAVKKEIERYKQEQKKGSGAGYPETRGSAM